MSDEHENVCMYETGRFRLRTESDYAIIDELEGYPPIMIAQEYADDGSEPAYADRSSVLHMLNELADTNPNEERHFYLKYRLDKVHLENDRLRTQVTELEERITELDKEDMDRINNLVDIKEELDDSFVKSIIDKNINELQGQYEFGQKVYKGCPMHNIMHSINTLKKIKKELGFDGDV